MTKPSPDRVGLARRSLLAGAIVLPISACAGRSIGSPARKVFGPLQVLARLQDPQIFTEGPAFGPDGALYFTNMPTNRIYRLDPAARKLSVFRENANGANGMLFDGDGRLLICEGAIGAVTSVDIETGVRRVLADSYRGFPIADVNDLARDAQGNLYFSSRPKHYDTRTGNVNGVYRLTPDGALDQILAWPDTDMPNGLAISHDQKFLYLIDADGRENGRRQLDRFNLTPSGLLKGRTKLHDFYPGRSGDGMCIDRFGNLFVAAGLHARRGTSETLDTLPGIHVFSPDGEKRAFLPTPIDTITNCTFGTQAFRNTLFVTCGKLILSVEVDSSALR